MTDSHAHFDPEALSTAERYKLLTGLVVPRPIGWIGSVSADGIPNLAPYSYFNAVCAEPMTVLFSSGVPSGPTGPMNKDTLNNVLATGEFTTNVVSFALAEAMNVTAGSYPPDVDEFDVAGLTLLPGTVVGAPMVAEAPARFECRMTHHIELGPSDGPPSNVVVFGEVVAIHVDPEMLDGTRVHPDRLQALGRLAGSWYSPTNDLFWMDRPVLP